MRIFQLPHRVGLAGMLAGTALLGAGLGTAAIATLPAAGAATAQLPAAAVREQNVNAAGRIRVALPSTGVGVNGNVSVSNLPTNSAGRVQTQNGTGEPQWIYSSSSAGTFPVTVANVKGTGTLKFLEILQSQPGNPNNVAYSLTVDGHTAMAGSLFGGCCWASTPAYGWQTTPANTHVFYLDPSGGIPFHSSLVIQVRSLGGTQPVAWKVLYTTGS
ncbi:MAG: hypothetical protein ACYCS7_06980 [Acidimicrobiales bacterium]